MSKKVRFTPWSDEVQVFATVTAREHLEMLEYNNPEMSPEQSMFYESIKLQLMDAINGDPESYETSSAKALFMASSGPAWDRLNFLCECAGLDPEFVRRLYRKASQ